MGRRYPIVFHRIESIRVLICLLNLKRKTSTLYSDLLYSRAFLFVQESERRTSTVNDLLNFEVVWKRLLHKGRLL